MFGVPEFINQVARKGKTFCGCVFLDLELLINKAYGKCEDLQRLDESCLVWEILYEQAIGTDHILKFKTWKQILDGIMKSKVQKIM